MSTVFLGALWLHIALPSCDCIHAGLLNIHTYIHTNVCLYECILFLWRKQKQQLRWHRLRIIYCEWATSSSSSGNSSSLVSATHTNTKVASTQKIVKHQTAPSCASDTNTSATIVCIYLYRHTHIHLCWYVSQAHLAHTLWREQRRRHRLRQRTEVALWMRHTLSWAQLTCALALSLFHALFTRRLLSVELFLDFCTCAFISLVFSPPLSLSLLMCCI